MGGLQAVEQERIIEGLGNVLCKVSTEQLGDMIAACAEPPGQQLAAAIQVGFLDQVESCQTTRASPSPSHSPSAYPSFFLFFPHCTVWIASMVLTADSPSSTGGEQARGGGIAQEAEVRPTTLLTGCRSRVV